MEPSQQDDFSGQDEFWHGEEGRRINRRGLLWAVVAFLILLLSAFTDFPKHITFQ